MDRDTSMSDAQVYTTSVTSTIGRPPRKTYFAVQLLAFAVTLGVGLWSVRSGRIFDELHMKELPAATEIILALGRFLSKPVGMVIGAGVCLGLGLLAIRGALDGFLKLLIWLNVLWVVGFAAFTYLSVRLPLSEIQQQLQKP